MANVPTIVVGTGNQQKVVTPALLTGLDSTGAIVALRVDASGNLLTALSSGTVLVANLGTPPVGSRAIVSNALSPAFGAPVAGGGAVEVPVYLSSTGWRVG